MYVLCYQPGPGMNGMYPPAACDTHTHTPTYMHACTMHNINLIYSYYVRASVCARPTPQPCFFLFGGGWGNFDGE